MIEGFESPFGVELLATVDWVINKDKSTIDNIEQLYAAVSQWNKRKAALIGKEQIKLAVNRLRKYKSELYPG